MDNTPNPPAQSVPCFAGKPDYWKLTYESGLPSFSFQSKDLTEWRQSPHFLLPPLSDHKDNIWTQNPMGRALTTGTLGNILKNGGVMLGDTRFSLLNAETLRIQVPFQKNQDLAFTGNVGKHQFRVMWEKRF